MTSQHQSLSSSPGGAGKNPVIRSYTANGTWTPPTDTNFYGAEIICVGAGGGGGAGRQGAQNTTRCSGGYGGGGFLSRRFMFKADLPAATYQITIGSGGTGGLNGTFSDSNGGNGTVGGSTKFESTSVWVLAKGGDAGRGGTNGGSTLAGNASLDANVPSNLHVVRGAVSGSFGVITVLRGAAALSESIAGGAGGGGGVINNGNAMDNTRQGVSGGGVVDRGTLLSTYPNAPAVPNSSIAGDNGTDQTFYWHPDPNFAMPIALGSGGGGGAAGTFNNATKGGDGGRAAGGGGGGASLNGSFAGDGGNGGNGCCVIIEYFGA